MPSITLIAHNIRSSHNVGSIFRTAEGLGVHKLILSGYTPYPAIEVDTRLPHITDKLHAQIQKTALGAESLVPFEHHDSLDSWLHENAASSNPLPVYALEQASDSIDIQDFIPPDSLALLLGEEVMGIEARYLDRCDDALEIPMLGRKESYNVSVACGIALYALNLNGNTFVANNSDQSIE